tara:strand:+ start:514 stop:705 length:192 start_codon:yes stop_codon:yes gene_type:complete
MKVGDLVVFADAREDVENPPRLGTGIVVSFDHDNDPIISFHGHPHEEPSAYYRQDIEVLNESR